MLGSIKVVGLERGESLPNKNFHPFSEFLMHIHSFNGGNNLLVQVTTSTGVGVS